MPFAIARTPPLAVLTEPRGQEFLYYQEKLPEFEADEELAALMYVHARPDPAFSLLMDGLAIATRADSSSRRTLCMLIPRRAGGSGI